MLSRSGRTHPALTAAAEPAAEPTPSPEHVAAYVPEPSGRRCLTRRVPADVPPLASADVPVTVTAAVPPQRNNDSPQIGSRRPAGVTRQLAADILEAEPGITRKEIAARLGVSTRRLREVLTNEP